MASIRPFRAIRPNPQFADQLVLTKPQAQSVAGEVLPPLKTLLETGARYRPETTEGQAAAYAEIRENMANLLQKNMLLQEDQPAIYIYEVEHPTYRQTGIWAVNELSDYTNGTIKTHELTFSDSVRRLKNYREGTGLEGSPVLLAYAPSQAINRIIAKTKTGTHSTLGNHLGIHRLWKIDNKEVIGQLISAFALITTVYLADGHHRSDSAIRLATAQQHQQQTPYQTLSSLYMATDELRIQEYDRVVIPDKPISAATLLQYLMKHFIVEDAGGPRAIQPKQAHHLGLYIAGSWYNLQARPHTYQDKSAVKAIDAAILQDLVLAPLFGITDPKNDSRLKYAGGEQALGDIQSLITEHPDAIVFTLCPLTIDELTAVADAGDILPPKSTWIDPKVPYGLLLHQHPLPDPIPTYETQ